MRCYCSICRKTAGGGGYAINLGAKADTLRIEGEEHITVFHARDRWRGKLGRAAVLRALRLGPVAVGPGLAGPGPPHASAIDTPLPEPPERCT
jgi:hypothetical protein